TRQQPWPTHTAVNSDCSQPRHAERAPPETRGSAMRSLAPLGILGFVVFASPFADAATISGTVTGPDGAPFRGAFVQARHAGLKMTVSVLSDSRGRFLAENLPAGDYRLQVRAVGFKADARTGVKLAADQNASYDFAL